MRNECSRAAIIQDVRELVRLRAGVYDEEYGAGLRVAKIETTASAEFSRKWRHAPRLDPFGGRTRAKRLLIRSISPYVYLRHRDKGNLLGVRSE